MFAALIPTGQLGTSLVHKDFSELFRRFHKQWLVSGFRWIQSNNQSSLLSTQMISEIAASKAALIFPELIHGVSFVG